jgi:DNA-binding PadR family transcriptional regulator
MEKPQPALPDEVTRLMPLTPAVFYILLALSSGPKHGYAIMQETGVLSDGSVKMGPATLYSTIQRLLALDLIFEKLDPDAEVSRRRYYELTGIGRKLLETDVSRMNAVLRLANARLRPAASEE